MTKPPSSKSRHSSAKRISATSTPKDGLITSTNKQFGLMFSSTDDTPNVNIPGIEKVVNYRLSLNLRILWMIAFILCSTACIYQLTDRILYYLEHPVVMDVKIEQNQTVIFPTMTMCSTFGDINDDVVLEKYKVMVCRANNSMCGNNTSKDEIARFPFSHLNLSMNGLQEMFSIKFESVNTTVACPSRSQTEGCNYTMFHEYVFTYWGSCLVLTPEKPLEYRGPYTYINGRLSNVSAMFWLHTPGVVNRHAAYFLAEHLHKGRKLEIRLGAKQFEFQNRTDIPCTDSSTAVEEQNDCIDRKLEIILNCSLPYIQSNLPMCGNWKEALEADVRVESFYTAMKQDDCPRKRICHDTLYSVTIDVGEKLNDSSQTNFRVYYPDNTQEKASEMYSYRLPALLSDIGGTFGFYMGFSIFTFIEIAENVVRKFRSLLEKRNE